MNIVEQLRDNEGSNPVGGCQGCFHSIMDEAADYIERLERSLKDTSQVEYAQRAEIERLREVLQGVRQVLANIADSSDVGFMRASANIGLGLSNVNQQRTPDAS